MEDFTPDFKSFITLEKSFSNIVYIDKDHTYEIDGKKCKYSVTKLLSKYTKLFDSDKISKFVAKREGLDQKDILDKWNFMRDYANHKGHEFHLFVENFISRKKIILDRMAITRFFKNNYPDFYYNDSVDKYYKEMAKMIKNFYSFYEWYSENYILIKSEFVVGDSVARLAGMMDNLSFNINTNELEIFDYKTNKKLETENKYGDNLLSPLEHLENCEYNKYALQLWLYKLMIERNTPFSVGNCYIIWFCGDNGYEKIKAPNFRKEAGMILDIEANNNK